ncbi:porin [Burkholderia gladioli]|uniref:porin n=1 Tax=Burkholderia gladioli TaxID=28095 RepID=UPI0016408F89|nr:porin [Burkholderia gladioli]
MRTATIKTARGAIIAGAIFLAFTGSAQAQTSVTLYGVLDASILYTSKSLSQTTGQNTGRSFAFADSGTTASRIGLQGREDLGGGLRAIFVLESGINTGNGGFNISNGNFFGRQAWVGLDSPYGTAKAGLQIAPFVLAAIDLDPRAASLFGTSAVSHVDDVLATGLFTPNAVSYTSPRIVGLQGRVLYGFGNVAGSSNAGRIYSGSVDYRNGGLLIDAAIYDGSSGSATVTPIPTTVAFEGRLIGAAYRFGPVTVKASFINYKVAGARNDDLYSAGAEFRPTPALTLNAGIHYSHDRNDSSNHSVLTSAGAEYSLSKRTLVYTQVALVSNHGAMRTGLAVSGGLFEPAGTALGADIGIRHQF